MVLSFVLFRIEYFRPCVVMNAILSHPRRLVSFSLIILLATTIGYIIGLSSFDRIH